jgi:hypothetical protein
MNFLILLMAMITVNPEDGSLLFIENGNKTVQKVTNSNITHVAITFKENEKFYVYEAIPPKVRKIELDEFYKEVDKLNKSHKNNQRKIWFAYPNKPFTSEEKEKIVDYLNLQIGRKYSVSSYLNAESNKKIHCGELVEEALNQSGYIVSKKPCIDSPIDVWNNSKKLYDKRILK